VTRVRRIGVTQRVEVLTDRSERRDTLDQAWVQLLEGLGFAPVLLSNSHADPAQSAASLELDGLVLSGGNDIVDRSESPNVAPERDETERRLLRWAAEHGVPALGVCRGLQVMNVFLGGNLVRVPGHVGKPHRLQSLCGFPRVPSSVNSFHQWGISADVLAPDLEPLAAAEDGTIEFARHRNLPWFGVMWHPERRIPEPEYHRSLVKTTLEGRSFEVRP
jgi:gamma-glutamyl-gamma-aminobutyrate hydrolase PuuD